MTDRETPDPAPPAPFIVTDQVGNVLGAFGLPRLRAAQGFWYLATPYSQYPGGTVAAFEEAARVAGWLLRAGVAVFCPITHTHPIAVHAEIDPCDHAVWIPADRPMMDAAAGLIVCQMPTWKESRGIAAEIAVFVAAGKPIIAMPWPVGPDGNRREPSHQPLRADPGHLAGVGLAERLCRERQESLTGLRPIG